MMYCLGVQAGPKLWVQSCRTHKILKQRLNIFRGPFCYFQWQARAHRHLPKQSRGKKTQNDLKEAASLSHPSFQVSDLCFTFNFSSSFTPLCSPSLCSPYTPPSDHHSLSSFFSDITLQSISSIRYFRREKSVSINIVAIEIDSQGRKWCCNSNDKLL